ncbi:MAG: DUF6519 domain-containing protein [Sulfuricaulis sp.]|nr:DUF6519 domain-containing protein [Sulfuricaulis sp.]
MSGDYSRVRFDPRIDLSGVLMQQGRVQLDSDWNEWVAVLDRRLRAESVDTFGVHPTPGITGVAVVSPQTPDGFKIEAAGGNIAIGRGRMYVDGLLAENHGGGAPEFDAVLAELRGKTALAYNQQPYLLAPPALPSGGPHLAYLEVWQREVTHLQQPNLVESAVGVDTTTRLQTVWQVRLLANVGAANCTTPDGTVVGWQSLILPSGGRMSIKAEGVPPDLDPCELPPSGGFRGLENQLYRIEIHDGGAVGAATFKWSRDNASVASNVVEIVSQTATGSELKLSSLGRDAVLRFNTGDWVEILDDRRELSGENGDPALRRGVMRKITVDDAKQTIGFSPALPANLIPSGGSDTLAARHTRVRRWDQKGTVRDANNNVIVNLDAAGSTGLIPVPAATVWVVLENGIQVQFSLDPSGGGFRCGDYWVSAARTADTSVETFTAMPPRAVHRHYARLAIVTFPDDETDCRVHWPPESGGCCTVNVAPGEDIQAALDALPEGGGCVCLKVGEHEISQPLRIAKSNVTLHGETLGARVVRDNGAALLQMGHPDGLLLEHVTVSGIHFEFVNQGVQVPALSALVAVDRCNNAKIDGCVIEAQELRSLVGILIGRSGGIQVTDSQIDGVSFGIWVASDSTRVTVARNDFNAVTADNRDGGIAGVFLVDAFGPCRVESNQISGFIYGVGIDKGLLGGTPFSLASGSVVAANRIARFTRPSEASDEKAFAIDVAANDCVIRENMVAYGADVYGGIAASGDNAVVENNRLLCLAKEASASPALAILVGKLNAQGVLGSTGGRIAGNSILGAQDGIVLVGNSASAVVDNRIESSGSEVRFGVLMVGVDRARVHGNRITCAAFAIAASQGSANSIVENTLWHGGGGATLLSQTGLDFSQNRVEDMRHWGLIGLNWLAKAVLAENHFLSCGYQQAPAIGIGVSQHFGELHIESCEVMNTGVSPDNATVSPLAWGIFADYVLEARVQSNNVTYANAALMDANQEHRALWLRGSLEQTVNLGAGQLVFGFSAQILDNKFLGPGRSALVETAQQSVTDNLFRRFERVFFNNNFCWHVSVAAQPAATVSLVGRSAIVMGNHIKTNVPIPSVDFHGMKDAVYIGNIAQTNPANFGGVPSPIPGFNKP